MRTFFLLAVVCFIIKGCQHSPGIMQEQHRPGFHFSPQANWMNDPNGMFYLDGEYHLFYQYNPDSNVWGPMHWGHAISTDLVNWEHLPVALYPDDLGWIFSGSAVVDHNNTSGLGTGSTPPVIAIFTHHEPGSGLQTQSIAYSNDRGRTWVKYENNPVIGNAGIRDFRDPKVIWDEEREKWIMLLAAGDRLQFFDSPDLTTWNMTGEFTADIGSGAGVWECPDLFPMIVETTGETKWVLILSIGSGAANGGSGTLYFTGDFDGKTFIQDDDYKEVLWLDHGKDNYAGVTWNNAPNGRHIFIGWMSNWQYANIVPTEIWRSAMTIPRELSLRMTEKGLRLFINPVEEFKVLRTGELEPGLGLSTVKGALYEIKIETDLSQVEGGEFGVELTNSLGEHVMIGYDVKKSAFYIDRSESGKTDFSGAFAGRHYARRISNDNMIKMHLFCDRSSVELFADDGSVNITSLYFPNEDFTGISIYYSDDINPAVCSQIFRLGSIW
ncbi:MAG: glycoside hydrolase family 32 protein [Bacteroidales bacterium]